MRGWRENGLSMRCSPRWQPTETECGPTVGHIEGATIATQLRRGREQAARRWLGGARDDQSPHPNLVPLRGRKIPKLHARAPRAARQRLIKSIRRCCQALLVNLIGQLSLLAGPGPCRRTE